MSQTVLLTGAFGGVGTMLRPMLLQRYGTLIVSDREQSGELHEGETFRAGELGDLEQMLAVTRGVDGIIHLGGQSIEAPWDVVLEANIEGLYNLYEASRQNGVKRVVFASSNHAVGFYPRTRKIDHDRRARPDSRYGVSKVFGEAIGSLYADKHGLRVLNIRIGHVALKPADRRRLSIWLHPDDLMQLCAIGLEHPELHCALVYGASHCERAWWDNAAAFALGYRPAHSAEDHVEHAMAEQAKLDPDPVADRLQGGVFCSAEFDGDPERLR